MKNTIILETRLGDTITNVAEKAKTTSLHERKTVEFEFNGVTCFVNILTNLEHFHRDYMNAHIMEWKTIGPFCKEKYDIETENELNKRKEDNKKRRIEESTAYKKEVAEKKNILNSKIKDIEIEFKDRDTWEKQREINTDSYGKATIDYAENWAKLMQYEFTQGKSIAQCAQETSNEADTEGITGFMYGYAVNILTQTWKYGEALRLWHNHKYNHDGEGVINPAVLTINKNL